MKSFKLITICSLIILLASCIRDDETNSENLSQCSISIPCGEPKGLITPKEADDMEELYKNNQYSIINEFLPSNNNVEKDAREVWFSLDEIKKFIYLTEQHAKENDYNNLGIRVYLGAKMENNRPKTTVFFVPTHSNGESNVNSRSATVNKTMKQASILNLGLSGQPAVEFSIQ